MTKQLLPGTSVLLCCLLLSATVHAQLQKIFLHPKATGQIRQSEVVDSIRFIPLEQKEGVPFSQYAGLVVTEKYFLLTDHSKKSVTLYNRSGKFITTISFKKLGESFYPAYDAHTDQLVFFGSNKNYALTPKDKIKIKLDWNNPRNKKYFKKYTVDLADSSFLLKKATPSEKDILRAYSFYKDYYWQSEIETSPLYRDSLDYEVKIYRDKELVKALFPYNRINEPRFLYTNNGNSAVFFQTGSPNAYLIARPYCDTLYKMVNDSVFAAYQMVLPLENSLPASFFTTPFKNKTERENFERNNGWMFHQVYQFYETPLFAYFMVAFLSNYETYVYHKQTAATYKAKNIKPDSSQYNLSLLNGFNISVEDNRFYKLQKAGDLLSFFKQHPAVAVPKELEDYLKSNPSETAPVLVQFTLKTNP